MKSAKYFLALGVAMCSGAVLAQSGSDNSRQNSTGENSQTQLPSVGASMQVDFGTLDSNTDKILSMDEVSSNSALSQAFSQLDADKSGGLTNAEFAKFESDDNGAKASGSAKNKGNEKKDDSSVEEKIESGND